MLGAERRLHDQVAVRVARHLVATQALERGVHLSFGLGGRVRQVDLVALDRPARQVARVVRNQRLGRERLHATQELRVHTLRRLHQLIVEAVRQVAGGRRPLDPPLPLLARPDVVVLAGVRCPSRVGVSVERPVRQIDAVHCVRERLLAERVRREPLASVPRADQLARLRLRHLERQERLGPERIGDLLVGHELRGTTELAALADLAGVEHRHGLAALAADRGLRRLPPHRGLGNERERREEVVLGDDGIGGARLQRDGRLRAAKRTDERLPGGIPMRLGAAGRAVELLSSGRDRGLWRCRRFVLWAHETSCRATGGTAAAARG